MRKRTIAFNYGFLYLDFNDAYCKSYSGSVEKCLAYLGVIFQSFY